MKKIQRHLIFGADTFCKPTNVASRRANAALHRSQASQSPSACARTLRDEITADYNDMIYAATREQIEKKRKAFIRKWRLKHHEVANSLEESRSRAGRSASCNQSHAIADDSPEAPE